MQNILLPGVKGRLDHIGVDRASDRLFIAARGDNSLQVIELGTSTIVHNVSGFNEPQGVVFDAAQNKIFVSNGGNGTVEVLDGNTYAIIDKISLGSDADNIRLDSKRDLVLIGYGSGTISGIAVVNASSDRVVARIGLDGHPEAFELDPKSDRIFVNVPTSQSIEILNETEAKFISEWSFSDVSDNFPMALDSIHGRLFVGTWFPSRLLVYDTISGRRVAEVNISGDTDDIYYDQGKGVVLLSCGEGKANLVSQTSPDQYVLLPITPTRSGARTSLYVSETGMFYLALASSDTFAAELRVYQLVSV
jgi:DNA-binding beta-propeller fold protein YncE